MRTAPLLSLLALGASVTAVFAQDYPPPAEPPAPPENAAPSPQFQQLPPLDQLVAPVALYPDPVIALLLPAAAFPDQIQQAAGNPGNPSLDPSVQGLAHYPDVVQWMAANPQWTSQLGGAFANSPGDVMNAIQDLRQRARAAGTLVPSSYENIVVDANGQIEILPAQPDTIYIPTYDPGIVYWAPPPGYGYGGYFGWSEGYPMGDWLAFDFDWHSRQLWRGDWYDYHRTHGGWNRPVDFGRGDFRAEVRGGGVWRAPAHAPAAPTGRFFSRPQIVRPTMRAGAEMGRGPAPSGRVENRGYAPRQEAPQTRSFNEQRTAPAQGPRPEYAPRSEQRPAYQGRPENQVRPEYHGRPAEQARPEARPEYRQQEPARPEARPENHAAAPAQRPQYQQREEPRREAPRGNERPAQAPQRQAPAARPAPQEEHHEQRSAPQSDKDKERQQQ